MIRKSFAMTVALAATLSLAACGGSGDDAAANTHRVSHNELPLGAISIFTLACGS